MPAAQATGLPPYVEPWAPLPQRSCSSRRVTIAESGRPLAIALAMHDDVRHDPGVLEGPHPPGPPVAALDLVGDEQDPVLVAERPEPAQERRRRRAVAALALDRLDEDRGDRRGRRRSSR